MISSNRELSAPTEGAGYSATGLYRPSLDCRMFSLSLTDFDPVCARAIDRMIDFYMKHHHQGQTWPFFTETPLQHFYHAGAGVGKTKDFLPTRPKRRSCYNTSMQIREIGAKSILSKSAIDGITYCVNPYVGCSMHVSIATRVS